jgi:2-dehydro-3-deoxyphosphooctonate aldolase (KDO 8-P synthase)
MTQNKVSLNNFNISNDLPFTLIAGPCALESHDHAKLMVEKLLEITSKANVNFIYKTSYDKANRTSLNAERGMGLDASLRIFSDLKDEYSISILTDVHSCK